MLDFDKDERKTNIRPIVNASMTADEFARAILTPAGYEEALKEQAENPAYAEYTHPVQFALREYAMTTRFSSEALANGAFDEKTANHLLEVATIAFLHVSELHTDTPVMMWASPWDFTCTSPAEFVAYIMSFSLETDEAWIDLEGDFVADEADVRTFVEFVRKHEPELTFNQFCKYYLRRDLEDEDEDYYVPDYIREYFPGTPKCHRDPLTSAQIRALIEAKYA